MSMAQASKKQGLGKGIRALLDNIDEDLQGVKEGVPAVSGQTNTAGTARIPLDQIEVNPSQPRHDFDEQALKELSESIKLHDIIQPITVVKVGHNRYQLISGERRVRASKMASIADIPAYVRTTDSQGMLELALLENLQRENLNAIEIALSYRQLMDECGLTQEQVSERMKKERSTVANYLRLLKLPPDIQKAVRDNHVIILDSVGYTEYDLFGAAYSATSGWSATSSAIFNLHTNTQRPIGWTSANAAGLPEFEGLVRYDEVVTRGVINHALSFTVQWTQQGFIAPASHAAGSCGANPSTTLKTCMPMGARYRLKAAYDCSTYSKEVQVICTAMKKYGVILTDNGANWFISGAPDPRWSDTHLGDLKSIPSSAMEMVQTGSIVNQ